MIKQVVETPTKFGATEVNKAQTDFSTRITITDADFPADVDEFLYIELPVADRSAYYIKLTDIQNAVDAGRHFNLIFDGKPLQGYRETTIIVDKRDVIASDAEEAGLYMGMGALDTFGMELSAVKGDFFTLKFKSFDDFKVGDVESAFTAAVSMSEELFARPTEQVKE